jgi:hypothetical protein
MAGLVKQRWTNRPTAAMGGDLNGSTQHFNL